MVARSLLASGSGLPYETATTTRPTSPSRLRRQGSPALRAGSKVTLADSLSRTHGR